MNPFFQNINIFLARKLKFFIRKISKNWAYFTRNSEFSSKDYLKISILLEGPYKAREIPDEFYDLVEKLFKKLKNGLDREGLLETGWKFWNIWRKSTENCRKRNILNIWRMSSIWKENKTPACKVLRFWTKNKEDFEIFW